jgi:hypothetical protein
MRDPESKCSPEAVPGSGASVKLTYEKPTVTDQGPVVETTLVNNDTAAIPDRGSS